MVDQQFVRRDETPQPVRVIPRAEVVKLSFCVAFFAGEFVMVGVVGDELKLAAPGIIIGFGFDVADRIGDCRGGLEVVREVVEDASGSGGPKVAAGDRSPLKKTYSDFKVPRRSDSATMPGVMYQ